MKLIDLIKLRWKFPRSTKIIIEHEGNRYENFEIEPKFSSEDKWILVFKLNSKLDNKN